MALGQDDKGAILAELFRFPIKRFLRGIRGYEWQGSLREFVDALSAVTTQGHRLPANPRPMLEAARGWIDELGWHAVTGRSDGARFIRFVQMPKKRSQSHGS